MSKVEELIAESKLNELLKKKDDEKVKKTVIWVLAIVGAVAAVAAIAYAVYCFFTPDYLEERKENRRQDVVGIHCTLSLFSSGSITKTKKR